MNFFGQTLQKGIIMKSRKPMFVVMLIVMALGTCLTAHAKPPKPGKLFVWVAPRQNAAGIFIHGHWNYTGPGVKGKAWIKGHFNNDGVWVPGYFGKIKRTPPNPHHPNKVWIPRHRGPHGRWVPGHWK